MSTITAPALHVSVIDATAFTIELNGDHADLVLEEAGWLLRQEPDMVTLMTADADEPVTALEQALAHLGLRNVAWPAVVCTGGPKPADVEVTHWADRAEREHGTHWAGACQFCETALKVTTHGDSEDFDWPAHDYVSGRIYRNGIPS